MAGAFTHFLICEKAISEKHALGTELWQFVNNNSQYISIGAASPDLPYLSPPTGDVKWADVMHYEKTNGIATKGYEELKSRWLLKTQAEDVKLAWLMGFISHLIADATIHPIVKAIVGDYDTHKIPHRNCEMTQDAILFNEIMGNEINYAEFSEQLKFCKASAHFDALMEFWKNLLKGNYTKDDEPHPTLWFDTYTEAIDLAEGGSDIVAIFRHCGVGLCYNRSDLIPAGDRKLYYDNVKLPTGKFGNFMDDGFLKTVKNVTDVWSLLYSNLNSKTTPTVLAVNSLKDWNLDTGVDMASAANEITYWA